MAEAPQIIYGEKVEMLEWRVSNGMTAQNR
jgi:hypothetical protein